MSGSSDEGGLKAMPEAERAAVLQKPFFIQLPLTRVREVLDQA
jgi:hypothetical protein